MTERIIVPGLFGNVKDLAKSAMGIDQRLTRRDAIEGVWPAAVHKTATELRRVSPRTGDRVYSEEERLTYLTKLVEYAFQPITENVLRVNKILRKGRIWPRR